MTRQLSRRDVLKHAGLAATGALVGAPLARAQDPTLRIARRPVEMRVTPASPDTVRISVVSLESGRALPIPDDGSLVARSWPEPTARFQTLAGPQTVRAGNLTVRVSPNPMTIAVSARDGRAVQQLGFDPETGALTFQLGDGPLLGLGEGGPQFDRRGSTDRMRSGQGGYQLRTHGGRVPIAWLVGTDGWALFIHHPLGTFDFTGSGGRIGRFDAGGADRVLPLDVFVVGTREPAAIMAEYARLTGFPEMPPLWSFGYQQSHRTLTSREEILQEAKTFREKKLPCDTLIYLGTGFCPSGWNTDNGEFVFNSKVFPDPEAMIRQLHGDHFKVVVHAVLEGRRLTGTVDGPCTAPPLPSGRTPDGRWPDDRQASCYWPVHKPILDTGVDGWWPDQGDGLDAPSRLVRNRMYWDGSRLWRPNERPYALHRNGHAGMQRYAAFLWSGDVYSTWETLKTHVPVAINTALTGVPFWGTDIGGFVPTKEFTGELYVRWFQFGAFCPLFRSHGRTWKLRLPWGWNTGELGPDEIATSTGGAANPDPSELRNAAVEPICRKYLELRYRLMPYLYSAVHEAHDTGMPILRALWLHYPDDSVAVARGDEYLWGRDILVAPVTEKAATSRAVYLPRGRWYDFWTEEPQEGGREITRPVDLATMPLFTRAGAILPLGPVKQFTSESVDEPMTVKVYPGADGLATLYEDDGVSFGYQKGEWMGIEMRWDDRQRRLDLRLAAGSRFRAPARRLVVRLAGTQATREVVFSGRATAVQLS
ncbi:MAG: glycoside hydrolase family 31 protein [Acidobacteria bacterium]|nr:glycoside hydrolase family 31 protein [Acidobacteriota bacterium]